MSCPLMKRRKMLCNVICLCLPKAIAAMKIHSESTVKNEMRNGSGEKGEKRPGHRGSGRLYDFASQPQEQQFPPALTVHETV